VIGTVLELDVENDAACGRTGTVENEVDAVAMIEAEAAGG
jgi:hypothetical protein